MAASILILAATFTLIQHQPELLKKADAIRATADEMKFKKIPWVTDLFEGFELAEKEKRPVFLYLITGDPLVDC